MGESLRKSREKHQEPGPRAWLLVLVWGGNGRYSNSKAPVYNW